MLQLAEIARREELRQAHSLSEIAINARPFCGGIASRAHPGSWLNTSVGMGFDGPINPHEITELITWFADQGIEPRIELCPFAHDSLTTALAANNFVPRTFENVFFKELNPDHPVVPPHPLNDTIEIRQVDPTDAAVVRAYSRAVMTGFLPPGATISEESLETSARVLRHPRTVAFAAWSNGHVVAGGAMEIAGEVCALFGMSTVPSHRRAGIQHAIIAARLNHAAAAHVKFATIGSKPNIATERTARRFGFQLAYTKIHLVRPGIRPDGTPLAPVSE
ncbi:MAG: hypothetical protein IBJ18_09795 [Phycisphaerales bacterium]|nr:hypothetical protein [Phycisphaerales bacterium]